MEKITRIAAYLVGLYWHCRTEADGYIWGRGSMDDKCTVLGIMEAVEMLSGQGFQPKRTIYLAFGHDEEFGGYSGAAKIGRQLQGRTKYRSVAIFGSELELVERSKHACGRGNRCLGVIPPLFD